MKWLVVIWSAKGTLMMDPSYQLAGSDGFFRVHTKSRTSFCIARYTTGSSLPAFEVRVHSVPRIRARIRLCVSISLQPVSVVMNPFDMINVESNILQEPSLVADCTECLLRGICKS